jgi:hypothetical protein
MAKESLSLGAERHCVDRKGQKSRQRQLSELCVQHLRLLHWSMTCLLNHHGNRESTLNKKHFPIS